MASVASDYYKGKTDNHDPETWMGKEPKKVSIGQVWWLVGRQKDVIYERNNEGVMKGIQTANTAIVFSQLSYYWSNNAQYLN